MVGVGQGPAYVGEGTPSGPGDYFDKRRTSTAHQRRLVAQFEAMGHKVTLEPAAA